MKIGIIIAALIGFAVALWLLVHVGFMAVFGAIASVGIGGFALICLYGLCVVALMGSGWFALMPDHRLRNLVTCIIGRQTRDSAGDVLPFSQFGGMVIGGRVIVLRGIAAPLAYASLVADVTTELMGQIAFITIGIGLCITQLRASAAMAPYVNSLLFGTVLLVPGIVAFVFLQKRGSVFAERLAMRFLPAAVKQTAAFGAAMKKMYDSPARLAASSTIHLFSWLASSGVVWLSVRLIGGHMSFFSAIAIEALLAALRSATVFVPSAIGVQEAGYAALMPLFGLGPEVGLAVSLLRRARDIVIGVPVLLAWQAMEGRRALARPVET
jgi:glycosyltransferase 2 family protein